MAKKNDLISISLEPTKLGSFDFTGIVTTPRTSYEIGSHDPDEYPMAPELIQSESEREPIFSLDIKRKSFLNLLEHTKYAMVDADDFRTYFNGIACFLNENEIHCISTDAKRMSSYKELLDASTYFFSNSNSVNENENIEFLIRENVVIELLKIFSKSKEEIINIKMSNSNVYYTDGFAKVIGRSHDKKFPNWRTCVKSFDTEEDKNTLRIKTDSFKEAINNVSIMDVKISRLFG